MQELVAAPPRVQDLFDVMRQSEFEALVVTRETLALRDAYLQANIVTAKYADDALHVAQATLARADVISSWNFRHLVNPAKIRAFSGMNVVMGYGFVMIMTPLAIVGYMEGQNG